MSALESVHEERKTTTLRHEAELFASYLLRSKVSDQAAFDHYEKGCAFLFSGQTHAGSDPVYRYACSHPWSLPFLDAALALVEPESPLRKRLFLMLAVLETHTTFRDKFLPGPRSLPSLAAYGIAWGLLSAMHAVVGLAILPLARRSR